jgi:hypothetical protein
MIKIVIVGGWLALNVLFFVALLFRRDRPAVREPNLAEKARRIKKDANSSG